MDFFSILRPPLQNNYQWKMTIDSRSSGQIQPNLSHSFLFSLTDNIPSRNRTVCTSLYSIISSKTWRSRTVDYPSKCICEMLLGVKINHQSRLMSRPGPNKSSLLLLVRHEKSCFLSASIFSISKNVHKMFYFLKK